MNELVNLLSVLAVGQLQGAMLNPDPKAAAICFEAWLKTQQQIHEALRATDLRAESQ
jgi:hypothetical protein